MNNVPNYAMIGAGIGLVGGILLMARNKKEDTITKLIIIAGITIGAAFIGDEVFKSKINNA